ncbi:class I SAM-dependent methyltransferase [Horticoccus luteus]|uniref:Class I SAM-dependent methyltransferase n=1 Tax=Horticoccus luteus TaxID=2862869 RepID=A0A8F9XH68_9BACT|nr:class I SAM-dependent methyltransferase [Horticoccus luteus]QYM79972.1 class I SAM-dependent methyltransferase [Horticoccus luteus]
MKKISTATVRADFNDLPAVLHYTRAAHELGLWASERLLIERFFPDRAAPLLEAGCGAGRVTLGLWQLGYHHLTAFDFAAELLDQARALAAERHAETIHFLHADATRLPFAPPADSSTAADVFAGDDALLSPPTTSGVRGPVCHLMGDKSRLHSGAFAGALFMFNGLMQIPGRRRRRAALRQLHRACGPGAPLLFTTHDRDSSPTERVLWRLEATRWAAGTQDPRLVEFGDRYFEDETGRTFMHLPNRAEILADLAATGWTHHFDSLRRDLAKESRAVLDFSDECRFWCAHRNA